MAVKPKNSWPKKWFCGIVLAFLVACVVGAEIEREAKSGSGSVRHRRSPKWSLSGSSSKKSTSAPLKATSAPIRASRAPIRATEAPFRATTHSSLHRRVTTDAYHPPATTSGPIRRATTHGPKYPHPKPINPTTTPRPIYPTQVYPRPIYPVLPNPPPIYVPPPPPGPQNPTIIIIKEGTPKPPKKSPSILILGGGLSSSRNKHATPRPTTTTTRRPKTTTEEPWHGVEGGYDRKTWIDFVKATQKKDIPLSGQWVRIRGGKSMREGYVEVLGEGGLWGSVCDVTGRWDLHKANIVCRQLGYRGGAEAAWQGRSIDNTILLPSQVREVNCGPTASTLLHCNLRRSKDGHPSEIDVEGTCYGRTRNVGVRCRPEPNTVCKFGEKAFGKSCYRMVLPPGYGSSKDFATLGAEAVKTCRSIARSELVSVTTQAENDFLSDWLQTEYPSVDTVLTSGIGTHSRLHGAKKPLMEWWVWSGQFRDVTYENWWPGWTSKPTITPIVPPKSIMCILLQNKFSPDDRGPAKTADYFFWKAYKGTSNSVPVAFICERPADDVGCLTPNQEYAGPGNISESGKACLHWNFQEVRNSPVMSTLFLTGPALVQAVTTTAGNACRRITLDKEPWCFVSPGPGQQPVPEQCLIPSCGQLSVITSYYEAPKKTNNYAPAYIQVPVPAKVPRIETLQELSYSTTSFAKTRTLILEMPAAKEVKEINPKEPDSDEDVMGRALIIPMVAKTLRIGHNQFFESDLNGTSIGEHTRTLVEEASPDDSTSESSPQLSNETTTDPGVAGALSIQSIPFSEFRKRVIQTKRILKQDISPNEEEESLQVTQDTSPPDPLTTTEVPPVGCQVHLENGNSPENRCSTGVTYPPVPTPPSLSYPHPENEIVTTTVQSTVTPKPSLYNSSDTIRTRYAAGHGRPFQRQLSASDLFLILNGILPQEEEAGTQATDGNAIQDNETVETGSSFAETTGQTESEVVHTEPTVDQTESTGGQTEPTAGQTESWVEGETESTLEGQTESSVEGETESTLEGQTESSVEGQTESTVEGLIHSTIQPTPITTVMLESAPTTTELNNQILTDITTTTTLLLDTPVVTEPSTVHA